MSQSITRAIASANALTLNLPTINRLLPCLELGDFAVLYGSSAVSYLASMLCVQVQLPIHFGGLASKAVFVDGGNAFRLYDISKIAQRAGLNPTEVLTQISIARAFTAYQMASLVMDKLTEQVKATDAKLVIVSDVASLFLDEDIAEEESHAIYNQMAACLLRLAKEKKLIVLATYLPHEQTERNVVLQKSTYAHASVAASIRTTKFHRYFVLQKHPHHAVGSEEFPSANPTLPEFFGGFD